MCTRTLPAAEPQTHTHLIGGVWFRVLRQQHAACRDAPHGSVLPHTHGGNPLELGRGSRGACRNSCVVGSSVVGYLLSHCIILGGNPLEFGRSPRRTCRNRCVRGPSAVGYLLSHYIILGSNPLEFGRRPRGTCRNRCVRGPSVVVSLTHLSILCFLCAFIGSFVLY